jgi:error-prone DNA polymerase
MADVEEKLRAGMARQGIAGTAAEQIIHAITSFALYGFPESHAASFALLAYASAYLKVHHAVEFYTALLNNQPMGFYHPATLVKDAQRHGLRVLPIDVTQSEWDCTVDPDRSLRLGLRYIRGLREEAGRAIETARKASPFKSIDDLVSRVPELRKDELRTLANTGALNFIKQASPLQQMTLKERLHADFTGTGLTVGRHPMAYYRQEMEKKGVRKAIELQSLRDGQLVKVAGAVIVRQRPGTAHGFVFLSLEDETGVANIIVEPKTFERNKEALVTNPFLLIHGTLQNQQGSISLKAGKVEAIDVNAIPCPIPRLPLISSSIRFNPYSSEASNPNTQGSVESSTDAHVPCSKDRRSSAFIGG